MLSLRDAEPVLDGDLIRLGPLDCRILLRSDRRSAQGNAAVERRNRVAARNYSLTEAGHSVARQLTNRPQGDPALQVLPCSRNGRAPPCIVAPK